MATQEDLHNMSDEELEAAFRQAKSEMGDDSDSNLPEVSLLEETPDTMVEADDYEVFDDGQSDPEEEVDSLEQPDVDSDDDASLDDDVEDDSEEESTEDEENPDGDFDELEEDQTSDDNDDAEDEEQPVRTYKYKANGKEYEFTEREIFERFGEVFGKAMNFTQKTQAISKHRKMLDAIESAELTSDDINLAIDVLKGDKSALAAVLKRTGVDALELDTDEDINYKPKDYGRNDEELAIRDVVEEISKDKEYATTYDVLENRWDNSSRQEFASNPELIRQLHIDVKSGMYDTITPIADKLKTYDGGSRSDLEYYKMASRQYFDQQARVEQKRAAQEERQQQKDEQRTKINEVKTSTKKREATKKASAKRKAAAPTKQNAGGKKQINYLDALDDESYDQWYKDLESKF